MVPLILGISYLSVFEVNFMQNARFVPAVQRPNGFQKVSLQEEACSFGEDCEVCLRAPAKLGCCKTCAEARQFVHASMSPPDF